MEQQIILDTTFDQPTFSVTLTAATMRELADAAIDLGHTILAEPPEILESAGKNPIEWQTATDVPTSTTYVQPGDYVNVIGYQPTDGRKRDYLRVRVGYVTQRHIRIEIPEGSDAVIRTLLRGGIDRLQVWTGQPSTPGEVVYGV